MVELEASNLLEGLKKPKLLIVNCFAASLPGRTERTQFDSKAVDFDCSGKIVAAAHSGDFLCTVKCQRGLEKVDNASSLDILN